MSTIEEETIAKLQAILAELEATPLLPAAGSEEALAMHEQWMTACDAVNKQVQDAQEVACSMLPGNIAIILSKIAHRGMDIILANKLEAMRKAGEENSNA